jgi:hypothetical protein
MLRLIDHINRKIPRLPETKDTIYKLDVVIFHIIDDDEHVIKIIGERCKSPPLDPPEQFNIDKLYYTDEIKTTIAECMTKGLSLKMACVQYRNFNNLLSKMYNTWKVIEIQKESGSNEWLQIDRHSKIF